MAGKRRPLTGDAARDPVNPELKRQMWRELERFAAREGLSPRAARQVSQQEIIDRLGGPAAAARAAGFTPAARGKPGGQAWEAAKRAFQRAATGQQELTKPEYLTGLRTAASAQERADLDRAQAVRGPSLWFPPGSVVRVTVAGSYSYSQEDRARDDLWSELEGADLDRLLREPWAAWDDRKGRVAGEKGEGYMPGLDRQLESVDSVHMQFVRRRPASGRPRFD